MVLSPYENLYIYLISGTLTSHDEVLLGNSFIGNWVEEDSAFLFFSDPAEKEVARLLKRHGELTLEDSFHFTYDDWQGGGFDSLKIGPFLVIPPWQESPSGDDSIKVLLDPGVVFGNCLHPTTRTCLEALSLAFNQAPFSRVLDLGTGTGVLAIAAALLGAEKTLAVDFNPLCVKTAFRNIQLNHLTERIRAVQGKAEEFSNQAADLVLANIQFEVIREFLSRNINGGHQRMIISGQMRSQSRDVKILLKDSGYGIIKEWDHDMTWFTIMAEKR